MAATASASHVCEDMELEDLMNGLGIGEGEIDDLAYEDVMPEETMEGRRLIIGKVHTNFEYGDFWFYKNMRSAWDFAQTVKFRSWAIIFILCNSHAWEIGTR